MKVFEITVEQYERGTWGRGSPWTSEVYHIKCQTAHQAVHRALRLARGNGFLKSHPLDITALREVVPSLDGGD